MSDSLCGQEGMVMVEQRSLVEALMDPRLGSNAKLSGIERLIDWSRLEPLVSPLRQGRTGRPPYAPLAMVKALYLQALYDPSDPGLEEALLDRLSFRRFCGFALDGGTPDETTLCRFRAAAAAGDVLERCFAEINRQLDAQGLVLRRGTILDASVVKATRKPPRGDGIAPGDPHPQEPGADWTRKDGKPVFGYRFHIGMDEGSGLIRKLAFTSARVQDVERADALVCGDEGAVYADRAYEGQARRKALKAAGIKDRIMHRRHRYMPKLPRWQARRNHLIARRRAPVEAVFSAMKRLYGKARTRCLSIERNAADFLAFATIYNIRRAAILAAG
ncbi:IS5 family transposase [Sphingomonas sp. SORGH_AS_0879]|uniref:IS5 family transposase n=1 Tax=Sphingomonas sp. SORGH_AS_0879 TaxID=3041790 RepID=UPI0027858FDC|nr:IS5 family transposase [Sphingomonas sp. SORGH_AS_0879]MDQ1230327.1 IS5 family transposase [Sphingomonas sp. SORGH_AS_0879]